MALEELEPSMASKFMLALDKLWDLLEKNHQQQIELNARLGLPPPPPPATRPPLKQQPPPHTTLSPLPKSPQKLTFEPPSTTTKHTRLHTKTQPKRTTSTASSKPKFSTKTTTKRTATKKRRLTTKTSTAPVSKTSQPVLKTGPKRLSKTTPRSTTKQRRMDPKTSTTQATLSARDPTKQPVHNEPHIPPALPLTNGDTPANGRREWRPPW